MAKRTITELIDDLDGGPATVTIRFGIDGDNYTIDLSEANAEKLVEDLERWVRHATAQKTFPASRSRTGTAQRKEELVAIRRWAAQQGLHVAPRGRIAASINDAYRAAH